MHRNLPSFDDCVKLTKREEMAKIVCSSLILTLNLLVFVPCHFSQDGNKERESDGAFGAKQHFSEGVHHQYFDHEAILGSKGAVEEFEHLEPEVAKQRLAYIVEKMDKNKDGFVDKDELTAWVQRSFVMLSEEESDERFQESDTNKDGQVKWSEYAAETYGIPPEAGDPPEDQKLLEDDKMMRDDLEIFQASDLNGDDNLDKKEFQYFSHPEDFEHTTDILYKRTMAEKDLNQDGFLDFQEFIHPDGKDRDKEWLITEKDHFDNDFDKNKDGRMDRAEVILWLQPNNWDAAGMEADHLIEESDDNSDGKLSTNEILTHHDVFVGSEVTDFGDHLKAPHKYYDEL